MSLFGDDNAIRERVNSLTDRVTREIQRREGIKARAEAELRSRRAEPTSPRARPRRRCKLKPMAITASGARARRSR